MKLTPTEAAKFNCPLARTFSEKKGHGCMGPDCILWRWEEVNVNTPSIRAAISKEAGRIADEAGRKRSPADFKPASSAVLSNPEDHGVTLDPEKGWCGLGGRPDG